MARISSEKAAKMIGSKFDLVLVAAKRARELSQGSTPKITTENGPVITALREIEQGLITKKDYYNNNIKERKRK